MKDVVPLFRSLSLNATPATEDISEETASSITNTQETKEQPKTGEGAGRRGSAQRRNSTRVSWSGSNDMYGETLNLSDIYQDWDEGGERLPIPAYKARWARGNREMLVAIILHWTLNMVLLLPLYVTGNTWCHPL